MRGLLSPVEQARRILGFREGMLRTPQGELIITFAEELLRLQTENATLERELHAVKQLLGNMETVKREIDAARRLFSEGGAPE